MLILSFPLISFSQWTQKGSDISGLEEGEYCGYAVSLNANGQVAAVGSPYYSIPEDYTGLAGSLNTPVVNGHSVEAILPVWKLIPGEEWR